MPYKKYQVNNNDQLRSIAQQADGKILATGIAYELVRFNLNGTVDSSFALNGRAEKMIGSYGASAACAVIVQSDGKIMLAGDAYAPQVGPDNRSDFTAARFHSNGAPDLGFNGTGDIGIDIQTADQDYCEGAVLQADDKLIMYGSSGNSFAIVRLNTDGTLDNSFNGNGKFLAIYGDYGDELTSAVVCPDGKILACGNANFAGDIRFVTIKLRQNGQLDSTFGINGAAITDFSGSASFARDIALQPDGKIVVVGNDLWTGGLIARYNADGSLDNSFGNAGKVEASISAGDISPRQLVITADGSLFLAGHIYVGSVGQLEDWYFVKYKPNGEIDSSYSATGFIIQLSAAKERIYSMLLQQDGKILTAGYVDDGQANLYAMVRFTPFPVSVGDISFNTDLLQLYPNPVKQIFVLKSREDGVFTLRNSLGQKILSQKIGKGVNSLQFPQSAAAGTYNAVFESAQGNRASTSIIYNP